jgi:hypothetical protein
MTQTADENTENFEMPAVYSAINFNRDFYRLTKSV